MSLCGGGWSENWANVWFGLEISRGEMKGALCIELIKSRLTITLHSNSNLLCEMGKASWIYSIHDV